MLKDVINVEGGTKEKYQLCERPTKNVYNKHILLIDETAYSGGTLFSSKQFLMHLGAKSVETFVISGFEDKADSHIEYLVTRGVAAWPWSFDN
jgi:phosphoribosylpyrophosphate synthetase